ncbi:GNAT family N-acetyltransferase [Streptomyces sp. NPDC006784]|uniref:GNAT family N-acetyltransferase n=1 Tax=Streptomyces sp. NPDC006784 TaxID=3364764 RepID=UPI00369A79EA
MIQAAPRLSQLTSPRQTTSQLRRDLAECWVEVTNAGGAAGFPFPPVENAEVVTALDTIIENLNPETSRLVTAHVGANLVGWLNLRRDSWELIAHWGTLHHVQTRTTVRGQGIGVALMEEARRIARDEMHLEQLHLAARGGVGLETFYGKLGWKEIGRWPGALRLADGQDRDEILMLLAPL